MTITSGTGSVDAKLKVEAKAANDPDDDTPATPVEQNPETGSPQTGDNSNMSLNIMKLRKYGGDYERQNLSCL